MASIKVTYFGIRGLGEVIRMLLKYGDIEFEDVRVEREKWPEMKPDVAFGQLPLYEEDGKVTGQSIAIARYVAKKVNLVGDDDWQNLEIDAIVDTISDLKLKITAYFGEQDPERKATLKETLVKETVPFYLERLDKRAEENNGYLAIGKLTWGDIYFVSLLGIFNFVLGVDIVENYPNLKEVNNNVTEIPSVKAWIESRPQTDY